MPFCLAEGVQVRRESWGLLFYIPSRHRLSFVRSGGWLRPDYFDGSWTSAMIVADISRRTGTPPEIIERSLPRLTSRLLKDAVITHEVR